MALCDIVSANAVCTAQTMSNFDATTNSIAVPQRCGVIRRAPCRGRRRDAGGRLDHLLGNLLALTSDDLKDVEVEAHVGTARVTVIRGRTARLHGEVGELVSLFAIGGPARGVTTVGLHYPLVDDMLLPGSSRGVSNLHVAAEALVTVADGAVLAIHPGPDVSPAKPRRSPGPPPER